ncbi:MAG: hypothetical protein QME94_13640, partial [Anaerolineae bacterium]|nr:hypothetical protein [Anaerolineae bacterium]
TIGAFMTAGMLPRLVRLREQQWLVFLLATNSKLWELDDAVRRPGRFDLVEEFGYPTLRAQTRYVLEELGDCPQARFLQKALEAHEAARRRREANLDLSFRDLRQLVERVREQQPSSPDAARRLVDDTLSAKAAASSA